MAKGSIIQRTRINEKGERVKGSLAVKVGYRGADGKWHQVWRSAKTVREAERIRTKLLAEHDAGTLTQSKGNLAEYLSRWLLEYAVASLSPTTAKGYQYIVQTHIVPLIGGLPLKNLRPEHLQRYYAAKVASGLSTTSVRHHHTLLHRALKHACQWGLMSRNPADLVSAPCNRRTEMHTLNQNQVSAMLKSAANTPYYCLFYVALQTGLRRGELLGLRWSDINLDCAELSVTRSTVQMLDGEIAFKAVKTARSRRTVALSPQTCMVLRQHLDKQMEVRARLRWSFPNDLLVFCQLDGSPLKGNSVWQAWHRMLTRIGITNIRFHDLRHTMATAMLLAGVHPKIVQERLGHASIATTLDIYSHVSPGLQQAAATKLDSIFSMGSGSNPVANTKVKELAY